MLTSQGFKRKRYADYLPEIIEQAKELFGENENMTERSPLGKFIRLQAYQRAEDNELMENLYNSRFVDTSEGIALEQNVKPFITKKEWQRAEGVVVVNLSQGAEVPIGTMFGTTSGVKFVTTESVLAEQTGEYAIAVQAVVYGQIGNVGPNEVTVILNPIGGLNGVTNPEPFTNGQDEEEDNELKRRYYESLGKNGNRRAETIRAAVLDEVEGIRACFVIENDTSEYDSEGRPPHSIETIVLGGEREKIAKTIFSKKSDGIRAYGKEQVEFTDSQGVPVKIGFSYAKVIPIYLKARIKKGANYPINGEELIKQKIVEFIGGEHGTVKYNGLGMAEDVVITRVEGTVLFQVEGVLDIKISLSTDGVTFNENNIPIGFTEVAETNDLQIEVSELV